MSDSAKYQELKAAIAGLEAQRSTLGDQVLEPALAALRAQLAALDQAKAGAASEERKVVTIVFADIAGFTALSETMDAEDVRALMNACFDQLVPVVRRYDGTIDKFIGDQIMALFGAPIAHEDDAERALRCALEMREALDAFNQSHQTALALHIGINTGPVVAGHVGSKERQDYSVMGDAVNLAARLEDASAIGEILAGPATHKQTAKLFEFSALPPIELKGKAQPVPVYRLLGLNAAPRPVRGIEGLRAPLTGRAAELKQLQAAIAHCQTGSGKIIALVGQAGLGKSRLLQELRRSTTGNILWAEGSGLPFTSGTAYWLCRQLLCSLISADSAAGPEQIRAALIDSIARYAVESPQETQRYLERLLDVSPDSSGSENDLQFVSPENLQRRMIESLVGLVRACCAKVPLVAVWEDLHWSDPSSLEVLEALCALPANHQLIILLTSRPDEGLAPAKIAELEQEHPLTFQRLDLAPLNRSESASLIHQLLKLDDLPESLTEHVLPRAEGNPFFLEELIRSFIDTGRIKIEHGRAVALKEIQAVDIPDTIQAVLSARIDRLNLTEKQTLQMASVVGRDFSKDLLSELVQKDDVSMADLEAPLQVLLAREFILQNEAASDYRFTHAITHSVAYKSLLLSRRARLHRLLAETMEVTFADRIPENAGTLGFHYDRGGIAEKALHFYVLAAERAKASFANAEAATFYRSALAQITPSQADRAELVSRLNEQLGEVLERQGFHEDARAAFARAIEAASVNDVVTHARLIRKSGATFTGERRFAEMGSHFDAAEAKLGSKPTSPEDAWWTEKLQNQLDQMFLLYWHGEAARMQELATRYRDAFEQYATPTQHGKFFQLLALALLTGSHYQPSQECLELAAKAAAQERGPVDFPDLTHFRFVVGLVNFNARNYSEAIKHCGEALQMAERCGDVLLQARAGTYLTAAHRCAGHVADTMRRGAQALALARKLKMVEYIAMTEANLAWASWAEGDESKAQQLAADALEQWHVMEDPYGFDWMALWPVIAISVRAQKWADALGYVEALFGPNQHPLPEKLASTARDVLAAADNKDLLPDRLTKALDAASELGQLTAPVQAQDV